MLTARLRVGWVCVHCLLGSASVRVRLELLVREANCFRRRDFVAAVTFGGSPQRAAIVTCAFGSIVMGRGGLVMLAIGSAARPSVVRTIFFAAVLLHALRVSIGAKSLPNNTTAIAVEVSFAVLPASRSNTCLGICRTAADCAARVLMPRLALVVPRLPSHFRRKPRSTAERFPITGPAVVATAAIRARALAGGTAGGSGATLILLPCLPLVRCGLAGHLGCKAGFAGERLAVAGPAVIVAIGSRTGTIV